MFLNDSSDGIVNVLPVVMNLCISISLPIYLLNLYANEKKEVYVTVKTHWYRHICNYKHLNKFVIIIIIFIIISGSICFITLIIFIVNTVFFYFSILFKAMAFLWIFFFYGFLYFNKFQDRTGSCCLLPISRLKEAGNLRSFPNRDMNMSQRRRWKFPLLFWLESAWRFREIIFQ